MMQKMKKIIILFRQYFVSGLVLMLPIFLTLWVLLVLFRISDNFLGGFINDILEAKYGYHFPGLGLLIMLLLIMAAGFLATNVFARRFLPEIERWLLKFPLVKSIYPPAKQLSQFILTDKNRREFRKAVLVGWPHKDCLTIGFITNAEIKGNCFSEGERLYAVFVPTVPNPITGFFGIYKEQDIVFLDLDIDQALKMVISGGVISPRYLSVKEKPKL